VASLEIKIKAQNPKLKKNTKFGKFKLQTSRSTLPRSAGNFILEIILSFELEPFPGTHPDADSGLAGWTQSSVICLQSAHGGINMALCR